MTIESEEFAFQQWRVRTDVAFVNTGRSLVVLALSTAMPVPLSLEGTAAAIWNTIDGQRDTRDIATAVADAYDANPRVVLTEVTDFLRQLEEVNLIERQQE
jgi:pyrroloquinoline quinone biosynthesis protein D